MSSNDDRRAFIEAMRNVKPLQREERVPRTRRSPVRMRPSRAGSASGTARSNAGVDCSDEDGFRRPGLSTRAFRHLRRGQFRIEAQLDLHGLTSHEARTALREFVSDSLHRGLGCVRIVHGKGMRSGPEGPVLPGVVRRWLGAEEDVLAFVSADARHGGRGAVLVLLRQR